MARRQADAHPWGRRVVDLLLHPPRFYRQRRPHRPLPHPGQVALDGSAYRREVRSRTAMEIVGGDDRGERATLNSAQCIGARTLRRRLERCCGSSNLSSATSRQS